VFDILGYKTGAGFQNPMQAAKLVFEVLTTWFITGSAVGFIYFVSEVRAMREKFDTQLETLPSPLTEGEALIQRFNIAEKIFKFDVIDIDQYYRMIMRLPAEQKQALAKLDELKKQLGIYEPEAKRKNDEKINYWQIMIDENVIKYNTSCEHVARFLENYLPPKWKIMRADTIAAAMAWPITLAWLIGYRLISQAFRWVADRCTGFMNAVSAWAFGSVK
jgi:hypothetical protein